MAFKPGADLDFNWQNVLQIIAVILFVVFVIVSYVAWKKGEKKRLIVSGTIAGLMLAYALVIHPFLPPIYPMKRSTDFPWQPSDNYRSYLAVFRVYDGSLPGRSSGTSGCHV